MQRFSQLLFQISPTQEDDAAVSALMGQTLMNADECVPALLRIQETGIWKAIPDG